MLNNLCWDQATANVQLQRALADCNASIALKRGSPNLDSRGFVLLRLQRYDEAIAAYDASIALVSTQSDSFYGRGIARLRKGQTLIGQGDLASARARSPGIDRQFEGYGLTP